MCPTADFLFYAMIYSVFFIHLSFYLSLELPQLTDVSSCQIVCCLMCRCLIKVRATY